MPARHALSIAIAAASLGLVSGCALMGEPPHVGGHATLDQAAAAARPDSSKKHRRLDVGDTAPPSSGVEVSAGGSSLAEGDVVDAPGHSSDGPSVSSHGTFGIVAGAGTLGGHRYDGFGDFGIELGTFIGPRWRFDLLGSVSPTRFASQSIAGQSFKDEFDLNFEISARYYVTAAHTFLGAYPIAGIRFGTLFWDYDKPVPIVEDGVSTSIDSDHINHFSTFAGMGLSLLQTRHLHSGFQLLGGARFYSWDTHAGFSNTLFPAAGYGLARFELVYRL